MRKAHVLTGAGGLVAAALIGGTLISAAFAAPTASTASESTATIGGGSAEYCEVYLDTLASELGVDRAALGAASEAAMTAVVDAAVADGELDEDEANEVRDRIAELDDTDCEAWGRHLLGGGRGGGPGFRHFGESLDAAATALGVERDELIGAFRDGTTLEELAEAEGVEYGTVTTAVTDAVRAQLDDAVADQDITQERADEIISEVEDWLADGGEPMAFDGGRHGHGRGGPGRP